jgi:glucose/arabinose dehydrogenase
MARWLPILAFVVIGGNAPPVAAQLRSETVLSGLADPVAVAVDPTDAATLFIVEQEGLIRIARDGALLDEPFVDLRPEVGAGGERGLLGLAFPPDHAESRRLFVNFTNRSNDTVVARLRRNPDNVLVVEDGSRFDLRWPDGRTSIVQPFTNHNGGHLAFGPDGYLYIGLGDGGGGGDPMNHAQNPRSLLGKMLRIDVSVADDDPRGYRVPEDNPFVDGEPIAALSEIWAFGLRNPWRYSFDDPARGGTSALTIADVGQSAREEINFEPAGQGGRNYGWRIREGRQPYDSRTGPAFTPLTEPIHDYGRSVGESVTGGVIYRGTALDRSFQGRYFYADFSMGRVFSLGLHLDGAGEATASDDREHTAALGGRDQLGAVSSFATDADGEILLINYSAGAIVRIVPDFDVVPQAPAMSAEFETALVVLSWTRPQSGVQPFDYLIERVNEGIVTERHQTGRESLTLSWAEGDCFRVRAQSREGWSGPASATFCRP